MACSFCSYTVAFQDQHTLPKRNILSQLLLWLVRMEFPFRTSTPSQSQIFSQAITLACYLFLACMYWPFRTSTLSQSEIFSQSYFCCLLSLLVYMLWPSRISTPCQSEIFSQAVIVTCSLCSYVCIGLEWPAHPPKVKYSLKLLLWLALSAHMYVFSFQDQHTLPKWNIL